MTDFKKALLAGVVVLALLTVVWPLTGKAGGPKPPELMVEFVGFTNNPVQSMSPVRVCVNPDATGLCALFRVTNPDLSHYVRFKTIGLDANHGHGWEKNELAGWEFFVNGMAWRPGYSCLYAVHCPCESRTLHGVCRCLWPLNQRHMA